MQFVRLRLAGFKSFVDSTELPIEPGLTGVVGPNGCGKSNLVEALRWVMGETSAKQMRGDGMDDVIFAGTAERPSRNVAEVVLGVDNSARRAPAALNDADELAIARRIERQSGSTYRVNGREVRARDVQLLFADAASGAHSPSMVGQGRVGAIVNARPSERRQLLEEAAGITGLHSRRHEAELRLRGAESNLERLNDVTAALEQQLQGLRRQARQAQRYRKVGAEIRRLEAVLIHLRHKAAEAELAASRARLDAAERLVAGHVGAVSRALAAHEDAAARLPNCRNEEAAAAARLNRLKVERDGRAEEGRRLAEQARQLQARLAQVEQDGRREAAAGRDAAEALARLEAERQRLAAAGEGEAERQAGAQADSERLQAELAAAEAAADALSQAVARAAAERDGQGRRVGELERQVERLAARRADAEQGRARAQAELQGDADLAAAEARMQQAEAELEAARRGLEAAEAARLAGDRAEQEARQVLQAVENDAARLGAEAKGLEKLLATGQRGLWPPMIDAVTVAPGWEAALGAALGDELDAPADEAAPVHWATLAAAPDAPALPEGVPPLAAHVRAPAALARRLAQVGVVAEADGARLRGALKTGQRLVTREGALWRWDGFTRSAGAETAAAVRLAQRNRLGELKARLDEAAGRREPARAAHAAAREAVSAAARQLGVGREQVRTAERGLGEARERRARLERQVAERSTRLAALAATLSQTEADLGEATAARDAARAAFAALPAADAAQARLAELRRQVADLRSRAGEARGLLAQLRRDAVARAERLSSLALEQAGWRKRAEDTERQQAALAERRAATAAELQAVAARPAALAAEVAALDEHIAAADAARRQAADALAAAETAQGRSQAALKQAEQTLAAAREDRVRAEGALEQARGRRDETVRLALDELDCRPERALAAAEVPEDQPLPDMAEAEGRLARLRKEREAIGPVNLRAEDEAAELEAQLAGLASERADLEAAIARLRQGIASLNREGRERLLEAFGKVDGHFRELFARLFGGGQAHLSLVEAEDPLNAGLEIMASPPGKRLQTLSLLSGGEKALTAMCLLFAVFMVNPAPLCVLDEVDAPLDDANVERFCNLVQGIARQTGTRFLVVTHHPFTMARMDRLFGVTMAEPGISQLVSVDLARAERLKATA